MYSFIHIRETLLVGRLNSLSNRKSTDEMNLEKKNEQLFVSTLEYPFYQSFARDLNAVAVAVDYREWSPYCWRPLPQRPLDDWLAMGPQRRYSLQDPLANPYHLPLTRTHTRKHTVTIGSQCVGSKIELVWEVWVGSRVEKKKTKITETVRVFIWKLFMKSILICAQKEQKKPINVCDNSHSMPSSHMSHARTHTCHNQLDETRNVLTDNFLLRFF